ncbi:MAG: hypothetical protein ABR577_02645 [Pyrinomonadaceae bacterium]
MKNIHDGPSVASVARELGLCHQHQDACAMP